MKQSSRSWLNSIFLFFGLTSCVLAKGSQLFSKIVITSDTAVCKKDAHEAHVFVFEYCNHVNVTLADQSRIVADTLKIVFDGKDAPRGLVGAPQPQKLSTMDRFRDIVFKNNVHVTSAQRQATADEARFDLKNQLCTLEGHVRIWQQKIVPNDIPVVIESSKAELNLATNQVQLLGSAEKPVQTTITLEGHPALALKKKNKKTSHDKNSHSIAS